MQNAVVFIQLGPVAVAKQIQACIAYVRDRGYRLAAIIMAGGSSRDAVVLVAMGLAQVVVVGFGGRSLAGEVTAAGGRVEAVHPAPHVVQPYRAMAKSLFAQLYDRGKTVTEIAAYLDVPTGEVRRNLDE